MDYPESIPGRVRRPGHNRHHTGVYLGNAHHNPLGKQTDTHRSFMRGSLLLAKAGLGLLTKVMDLELALLRHDGQRRRAGGDGYADERAAEDVDAAGIRRPVSPGPARAAAVAPLVAYLAGDVAAYVTARRCSSTAA